MSQVPEHLIDRIPSYLMIADRRGDIQAVNAHALRLLGHTRETFINQSVSGLLPDMSGTQFSKWVEASLTTAKEHITTTSARHKDGSSLRLEIHIGLWDKEAGEVILSLQDISEREAAVEALNESQKINKTGTWSFDLAAGDVRWSPELFRIFDLPVSPLAPPYETHKALFTPESWQRLEPAVAAAAEQGRPYELELTLAKCKPDGRESVAVARCVPHLAADGSVEKLVGTFQDISELAYARADRDNVLDRLTLAKTAAGIGIWEWDRNTDQLVWDERMFEIYGHPREALRFSHWQSALHPDDVESAVADLNHAIEADGIFTSSFRVIRDGEIRHILAFAALSGEKMVGVNMDVTEQARLREETRRLNNLESLGTLAGGIAHDFNNQLSSIGARADLLTLKSNDKDFVKEVASELRMAVQKASSLTKQLLTFAKGSAPARESASAKDLVQQNVEFSLHGSSMDVHFDFAENLWNVSVDPHQIGQVIQNIVINAVQAMPETGGTLSVSASNTDIPAGHPTLSPGHYIELVIEDDGPGIPASLLPRIFDPYFTTRSKGHGLGLAICHSIVTQHEGNITVDSPPGRKTRFTIHLPATQDKVKPVKTAEQMPMGSGKVLVIDDMPDVLTMIGQMVEALGYKCTRSSSVSEAVNAFDAAQNDGEPYGIVITDLTMPGSGGGVEVLRELKSRDESIEVIVASGYASDPIPPDSEALGFSAKLEKPFTLAQLASTLERFAD